MHSMWGDREIRALRVPHLQTPLFNSNNNNNTHRPYFHSQAFNLVGCVGGGGGGVSILTNQQRCRAKTVLRVEKT